MQGALNIAANNGSGNGNGNSGVANGNGNGNGNVGGTSSSSSSSSSIGDVVPFELTVMEHALLTQVQRQSRRIGFARRLLDRLLAKVGAAVERDDGSLSALFVVWGTSVEIFLSIFLLSSWQQIFSSPRFLIFCAFHDSCLVSPRHLHCFLPQSSPHSAGRHDWALRNEHSQADRLRAQSAGGRSRHAVCVNINALPHMNILREYLAGTVISHFHSNLDFHGSGAIFFLVFELFVYAARRV